MSKKTIVKPEILDDAKEVKNTPPKVTATSNHCPYRYASLLQQALAPDKMRVAFLLGAGCPVAIRISDGQNTKPLIPDIAGLTKHISETLQASQKYKTGFNAILKRLKGSSEPTIEDILSHVRALNEVAGNGSIDGLSKDDLDRLDAEICRITTEIVKVKLASDDTPYHHLATWIRSIKRAHPIEIFTPNYDLLMEQALEERRVPYFDGFVGSRQSFFDLASIEHDNLPVRWARLWKMHGSINWWRTSTDDVERCTGYELVNPEKRQMIYPSHLKYEQSRRMPYLAMLDRLKAFLAKGQAVLITCGYSFSDQHLNDVILQGLEGNPNAVCFGLLFSDLEKAPEAVAHARKYPNLSLLAANGAVLGTIERDWHSNEKSEHTMNGLAVKTGKVNHQTNAPDDRCKFLLGDFKSLGEFLAHQLPGYNTDSQGNNHDT